MSKSAPLSLEPGQAADTSAAEHLDPGVLKIAVVVLLGPLMAQMDSTIVNVSLSTIRQQLHSSIDSAQWIISGYLLALALMLPLNAWLVERLGAKRLYLACFSAFTLASLLCGLATTMNALIGARIIQGMAGGLMAPMAQMMIARVAGKHMARVMGYTVIPVLIAPILGPVIAGAILKHASWPWLFYINLPIGILAVALAMVLLPGDKATARKRPFDFPGFLLISPGLVAFLYGLDHASEGTGALILVSGLILVGAFGWHSLRKKSAALIDLRLFHNRIFATATRTQFLSLGVIYAGQMLVPLYLITGCGLTAARAGWMLAPMGLGMLCVYPMMGFLTDKFGCRAVSVGGVLLNTLGTLPFLWMIQNQFSPALMVVAMLARGAGQGAVNIPAISAAYASVPKEQFARATTAINIAQRLGGPVATTVLAMVISFSETHFPATGARVFTLAFVALIGLQLLLLASASHLPARIHQMERKN